MKMYVQQKVFRLADEFIVYGEDQQPLYYVYGKLFSFGTQLSICDINNQEVGSIKQELFSFLSRYHFYIDNVKKGEIVRRFNLFYPSYRIEGLDWECEGDFWAHNYSINSDIGTIATIEKEWLSWGDFYTIDVNDEKNILIVLMICLTIDACLQARND